MSALPRSLEANPQLDTWVRIDPQDTITLFTGKVELGQGIRTAIARIGAEELDVALERIRVQTADTAHGPTEGITAGSTSLEQSGAAMRAAAAEARAHLLALAAARLAVAQSELGVDDGTVIGPRGQSTNYWELLGGRRFDRAVSGDVAPRSHAEHRLVGRRGASRLDMVGIVTGTSRYVCDLTDPAMLHGRVVRPPGAGASLRAVDEGAAAALPGVVAVVRDGSFLGVAAVREEQADRAAEVLSSTARWSDPAALPPQRSLHEWLRHQPTRSFPVDDGVAVQEPVEPIVAPPDAVRTLTATYTRPYTMHGSIGPSAALAQWTGEELRVWCASQGVLFLQAALASAFEIAVELIRVIHVEGPGCYGHNGADDVALDAALLARAAPGRPVLVRWTREDEHGWEPYGPAMLVDVQASLDSRGMVVG